MGRQQQRPVHLVDAQLVEEHPAEAAHVHVKLPEVDGAVLDELAYYADCAAEEHWSRAALVELKNLVHDDTTWEEVVDGMLAFPWEETWRSGNNTLRAGAPRSLFVLRAMAKRKGWKKRYNSKARISREEHARVVAERDELSRQVARLTAQLAAATARDVDH